MLYWWIAAGGLAGTFARFGLQGYVQQLAGPRFPWGTFAVNVTGSLVVGFVARFGSGSAALSPEARTGLLIGFCGGYTTFSTYSYETVRLLQDGAYARATAYAVGTVIVSLGATLVGISLANRLL